MNNTGKVTIKGKEYVVKYGLRTLFKHEEIEGHPFEFKKMEDSYRLLHASLLAHNTDYCLSFDELLDACDEDSSIFGEFVHLTEESAKRESVKKKKLKPENQ